MEERLYEAFLVINDIANEWEDGKISAEEAYDQLVAEVDSLQEFAEANA